jgi:hypothetical protein
MPITFLRRPQANMPQADTALHQLHHQYRGKKDGQPALSGRAGKSVPADSHVKSGTPDLVQNHTPDVKRHGQ